MPKMRIDDIKIGERQRKDLGDIEGLAKSIQEIGLLHPVVVNRDTDELISGRRRIEAFKFLGRKEIPVRKISIDDVLRAESDENVVRKDFLLTEAVAIGRKLEPRLREGARERQKVMGRTHGNPSSDSDEGGRTDQKIGDIVGMGKDRYRKAKYVVENAEKEERFEKYRDLMDEEGNVEKYYRKIKRIKDKEEREKKAKNLPKPEALDRNELPLNEIICADALEILDEFPENSIHFCMFSPGYWSLRDYGMEGQIGLEEDYRGYIDNLVRLCRKLKRVLREDGSLWMVIGDTYAGSGGLEPWHSGSSEVIETDLHSGNSPPDIEDKCKMLMPYRVALSLIDDGWICRNDIVWVKQILFQNDTSYGASMPTGVEDRLNNNFEMIFHFVQNQDYWYDLDAIRILVKEISKERAKYPMTKFGGNPESPRAKLGKGKKSGAEMTKIDTNPKGKNPGDAWRISTAQCNENHFAAYPPKIVERPLKATCPPKVCSRCGTPYIRSEEDEWIPQCSCKAKTKPGITLDPLCGIGTTCSSAKELGRSYIGIDINPDYVEIAKKQIE